jgi:hypothetical protein
MPFLKAILHPYAADCPGTQKNNWGTKMNKLIIGGVLLMLNTAPQAVAGVIANGDFADCSYSGWAKDTDGFGDVSVMDDFTIASGPDCAAQLLVDAGNTEAWFANTLFQNIALNSSEQYRLNVDLSVGSELSSADNGFIADYFVVAFGDGSGRYFGENGQPGNVFSADIDGNSRYSLDIMLDNTLSSFADLTLEFQLLIGFDEFGSDLAGSFLQVDNVSVTAISDDNVTVSAPSQALLLGLGLAGLALVNRQRSAGGRQ